MKRINPATHRVFKRGDTREQDRRVFINYDKSNIVKSTGFYYETWVYPEVNKASQSRHTPNRKQKLKRRLYWLRKYKMAKGCQVCGYNKTGYALDFDHITSKDKIWHISRLVRGNRKILFQQIRKCRVLCANCHRESTERGEYKA